jgi:hypothetical protein
VSVVKPEPGKRTPERATKPKKTRLQHSHSLTRHCQPHNDVLKGRTFPIRGCSASTAAVYWSRGTCCGSSDFQQQPPAGGRREAAAGSSSETPRAFGNLLRAGEPMRPQEQQQAALEDHERSRCSVLELLELAARSSQSGCAQSMPLEAGPALRPAGQPTSCYREAAGRASGVARQGQQAAGRPSRGATHCPQPQPRPWPNNVIYY